MAISARPTAEPHASAPIEAWRSWIRELICAGRFTARFFSWVCTREHYFLKIPRVHGEIEVDLNDGRSEAAREYQLTRRLAQLDGMVDAPFRLIDGCIVKRRLSGPDLWSLAKQEGGTSRVRAAINQGLLLAARLHRLDPATVPDLRVHDYANDPFLQAPAKLCRRMCQRPRSIVVSGLEARNFKQDHTDGEWKFFDPHEVVIGVPEDDFARYVLSLLMINWGRHVHCRIWTQFDYRELVRAYEAERGAALDRELLHYMFQRNIARRRREVRNTTRDLPSTMQVAARAYEALFFWQVGMWGSRHGL